MPERPTFPRFPRKWRHRSVTDPRRFAERYLRGFDAPRRCLVLWSPPATRELVRRYRARAGAHPRVFVLPPPADSIGIVAPRGVGAPTTVIDLEELAAAGAREFVGVGFAGGIGPEMRLGTVVVCEEAIRDEGTSHHYAPAHLPARPSPTLRRWLERALRRAGIPFTVGPDWTTDAPYRETIAEIRHYRGRGVLTVEMEASAIFLFGRARRIRTASAFVVSDRLTERGWRLEFHRHGPGVAAVGAAVLEAWLSSSAQRGVRDGTARAGSTAAVRRSSRARAGRSRARS